MTAPVRIPDPRVPVRVSVEDAQRAYDEWGANCGPGAIAGVLGMTLDELRPFLGDFERKRYTNPMLMWSVLSALDVRWRRGPDDVDGARRIPWPLYGLARVQWHGPWMAPGVPMAARYYHTHWVGADAPLDGPIRIFDVNCLCVGGWVPLEEWSGQVIPWLLRRCEPRATGAWHLTHAVDVPCTGWRGLRP